MQILHDLYPADAGASAGILIHQTHVEKLYPALFHRDMAHECFLCDRLQYASRFVHAEVFGSPRSGSYTGFTSLTQPSTSSSATLTFTPLIAGYWQFWVECDVAVVDTKTSQTWTGAGNEYPQPLTRMTISISSKSVLKDRLLDWDFL